jgi:integrating conjugative element protein (TIGR03759 family)
MFIRSIFLLVCCCGLSFAENFEYSNFNQENSHNIKIDSLKSISLNDLSTQSYNKLSESQQSEIAKQYYLTTAEYKKYLEVKSSSFSGQYYAGKNVDPNFLLADYYLSQSDKAKANRYIIRYARLEYQATQRLLYIQKQFQKDAQKQFPTQTPIKLKGAIPYDYTSYGFHPKNSVISTAMSQINKMMISSNGSYVLIEDINDNNKSLNKLFQKIASLSDVKLDIYFVGNASDSQIINWAKQYNLGPLIQRKVITINHAGKFVSALSKDLSKPVLPGQLYKTNNGDYQIINWSIL